MILQTEFMEEIHSKVKNRAYSSIKMKKLDLAELRCAYRRWKIKGVAVPVLSFYKTALL